MSDPCTSDRVPWSILSSASSNSQLAGVLAGLLVATITVLIASGKMREVRTLGVLAAAMVALALDSYLFSYLTGLDTSKEHVCERAWAQGMGASGVLALGAVALMTGIGVMLVQHLVTLEEDEPGLIGDAEATREKTFILWVAAALSAAVVAATTILLAAAYQQNLAYVVSGRNELGWTVFGVSVAVVGLCWGAIVKRTRSLHHAIQNGDQIQIGTDWLPWTSLMIVGYALAASTFGGIMIYENSFAGTGWGLAVTYILTVATPAVISIFSSCSVPKQL